MIVKALIGSDTCMDAQEKLLNYPCVSVGSVIGVIKKFLCDGQNAIRPAILYMDRSCLLMENVKSETSEVSGSNFSIISF